MSEKKLYICSGASKNCPKQCGEQNPHELWEVCEVSYCHAIKGDVHCVPEELIPSPEAIQALRDEVGYKETPEPSCQLQEAYNEVLAALKAMTNKCKDLKEHIKGRDLSLEQYKTERDQYLETMMAQKGQIEAQNKRIQKLTHTVQHYSLVTSQCHALVTKGMQRKIQAQRDHIRRLEAKYRTPEPDPASITMLKNTMEHELSRMYEEQEKTQGLIERMERILRNAK